MVASSAHVMNADCYPTHVMNVDRYLNIDCLAFDLRLPVARAVSARFNATS